MIRRIAASLLLLGLPTQAQTPRFEIPMSKGLSTDCPFVEGELLAPSWVFGTRRHPVRLLFDTGAEINLLKVPLAESFGNRERVSVQLTGSRGGKVQMNRRWTLSGRRQLLLGPARFSGLTFFSLPSALQQVLERGDGLPMDGLFGLGALAAMQSPLLMEFDPEGGGIRFHPAEGFDLSGWVRLPTSRRGSLVFANLTISGRTVKALVDTGYAGGLELSEADAQGLPFQDAPPDAFQTTTLEGTLEASMPVGRMVSEVRWGEASFPGLTVLRRTDAGPDSLLGARFWMAGRWLLSPKGGQLWIPASRLPKLSLLPEAPVRWGFLLEQVNALSDPVPELRITQIKPGSLAALGGLKAGDRLWAVDSLRGDALILKRVRPWMREAGRSRMTLEVEREGQRLTLTLAQPEQP